jgi:hypothetical protein
MGVNAQAVHRAVRHAKQTPCPNAVMPLVAWNLGNDRSYEVACGSWSCSYCSRKKRAAVALVVADGCERAFARGERVRFVTLTDGSAGEMTVRDVYESWNRLRTALRKADLLREYAAVIETTDAGALHLHALTTGRYLPQRELSSRAIRAGFGRVADIRAVKCSDGDAHDTAGYVAKQVAAYVSKERAESLRAKTARRRRPLRCSRGWGLSLAEAEREVVRLWRADGTDEEPPSDVGPWVLIFKHTDGSLTLRRAADHFKLPARRASDEAEQSVSAALAETGAPVPR